MTLLSVTLCCPHSHLTTVVAACLMALPISVFGKYVVIDMRSRGLEL